MKSEKNLSLVKSFRTTVAFVLVMCMVTLAAIPSHTAFADTDDKVLEELDLSDISNWTPGCYSWNSGKVKKGFEYRLRLNDYVTFRSPDYEINISDDDYKVLIRELDESKKFIKSGTYDSGDAFSPDGSAKYLAIGIYNHVDDKGMDYDKYVELFENGFTVSIIGIGTEFDTIYEDLEDMTADISETSEEIASENKMSEDSEDVEITDTEEATEEAAEEETAGEDMEEEISEEKEWNIDKLDLTDFSNWTAGCYNWTNGKVMSGYMYRIRLSEYVEFDSDSYDISVSDTDFSVLIRELDENMKFVKSSNLPSGSTFTPSDSSKYLAVGLYNTKNDTAMSYEKYEELFENGFTVEIKGDDTDEEEADTEVKTVLKETVSEDTVSENEAEEETETKEETLDELLLRLFTTDDTGWYDVSKYKMEQSAMYVYRYNLQNTNMDFQVAFNATLGQDVDVELDSKGYVTAIRVPNKDKLFVDRYEKAQAAVDEAMSRIDDRMSDLEKALVLHDFLDEKTSYVMSKYDNYPGYVLAYGKGICGGYAHSYRILLTVAGIKSHNVFSSNHAWNLVTIDGEQYHVDTTWDDTKTNGKNVYCYFIRSSAIFKKNHQPWTSYVYDDTADSTLYDDWFVHKVIGRMKYYEGNWYYVLNGSIMKSRIDGTDRTTLVESDGTLSVTSVEDGILTYTEDGNTFELEI